MSLRGRLAVFVAVAVGLAVGVVAFFAYGFARQEARDAVDAFLRQRGPVAGIFGVLDFDDFRGSRGGGGQRVLPRFLDDVVREDAVAQFLEADGTVITIGLSPALLPVDEIDLRIAAAGGPDYFRDATIEGLHFRILTRPVLPGVAVQVGRDLTETDAILDRLRTRMVLLGLVGAGLAAAVGWLVSTRSLRPVALLTDAAEQVTETRELGARIAVERGDELGRLAGAFNTMLATLEQARLSQQRLVADASHELRTPLTSLRTNIELLDRGAVTGTERQALLADVLSELGELSHLVDELVDLATIGRDPEDPQRIEFAELVERVAQRLRRRTGIEVLVTTDDSVVIARPNGLERAMWNLLDNAAKWGGPGRVVRVTLEDGTVSVRDRGPGIPEADLPHVFERFYRSTVARSQPGSGLGLSIVAAVAEEHQGSVFARNASDGGAIVGFTLPTSADE